MYSVMNPAKRAPPATAHLLNFTTDTPPENAAVVAVRALLVDDDDEVIPPLIPATPLVADAVPLLPTLNPSLDVARVALLGGPLDVAGGVFVVVRTFSPLVEVPDTTAVVEGVGTPRMDTVPKRSVVEAAFASGPADRGKPNTLQMLAIAPKVAVQA